MNMISEIRQRVSEYGFTNITVDEFNHLQAEWITRANIEVIPPVSKSLLQPTATIGCYCKPGVCMAPVVMGSQTPCRNPAKAAQEQS
jgi:hypothetical protein